MNAATSPPPSAEIDSEALTEVVNGEVVEKVVSAQAIQLASRLSQLMGPYADRHQLGAVVTEMLFILDAERNLRRRPDVAFVSSQRWPFDRDSPLIGDWEVIPDLAVEVVSPNDTMDSVTAKVGEYFGYGVLEVWVVLPVIRQVYIYDSLDKLRIIRSGGQLETPLIPGWQLPLTELFRIRVME
jgi:Uma2 family endonuclease